MTQRINLKTVTSQQFIEVLGDQLVKIEAEENKVEDVKKRLDGANTNLENA